MPEENVLLVDSELLTRDLLGNHFRHLGFKVFAVETASAALKLVPQSKFRLAVVSDKMGDMQLKELVGRLRAQEADSLIFLVTAQAREASYLESRKLYDVIVKPFRLEEVSVRFRHAVENISLRRALRVSADRINRLEREVAACGEAAEEVAIPDLSSLEDDGTVTVAGPEMSVANNPGAGLAPEDSSMVEVEDDLFDKIRKLDVLRKAGILTSGEFNRKKKELLDRI
jgi:DNA-binding response OmpR family regulator